MSEQQPPDPAGRNLGRRMLIGTVQLGVGSWVSYGLNFAIQIGLARLLGPEQFGFYAFVFAINELLNIIAAFSLRLAVIQAREAGQSYLDTAFAMCAGLGALAMLVAGVIAPFLWFYRSPEAAWFLLLLSVARIWRLLAQVPEAVIERGLLYGPITMISVTAGNVPNVVALGLAWLGFGAWSLVLRDMLVGALTLGLSWWISGYRFRGQLNREDARQLFTFSTPMFFSRSIDILVERTDRLVGGLFFGNAATGLLDRARFLAESGMLVMRPVERLSLNLFARVQGDRPRMTRSFDLVNYFMMRVMFAGSLVLFVFPAETIRLIYGAEWVEAAGVLRVLAVYSGCLPILLLAKALMIANNTVTRIVRISAVQAGFLVIGIAIASQAGSLTGVAVAVVITTLVGLLMAWSYCKQLVDSHPAKLALRPIGLLVVSASALLLAVETGTMEAVPWGARPFLAGALYVGLIVATEFRTLLRETAYLRAQLAGSDESSPA